MGLRRNTMSDFKSKLPDLKELTSMTGKLFNDIKASVGGIIDDYKKKREGTDVKPAAQNASETNDIKEAKKKEEKVEKAEKAEKAEKKE